MELTNENFMLFAAKHYRNPQCESTEEFVEDVRRLKYIKKLVTRYLQTGELKERLILNHIIILNNVFGPEVTTKILILKMSKYMVQIKPFLILLEILPDDIHDVGGEKTIDTTLINMDENIVKVLRAL